MFTGIGRELGQYKNIDIALDKSNYNVTAFSRRIWTVTSKSENFKKKSTGIYIVPPKKLKGYKMNEDFEVRYVINEDNIECTLSKEMIKDLKLEDESQSNAFSS